MDWFLAVIYVIMVKNTPPRLIFRKKSDETGPQAGANLSKRTQRSGSLTAIERLKASLFCFPIYDFFV